MTSGNRRVVVPVAVLVMMPRERTPAEPATAPAQKASDAVLADDVAKTTATDSSSRVAAPAAGILFRPVGSLATARERRSGRSRRRGCIESPPSERDSDQTGAKGGSLVNIGNDVNR